MLGRLSLSTVVATYLIKWSGGKFLHGTKDLVLLVQVRLSLVPFSSGETAPCSFSSGETAPSYFSSGETEPSSYSSGETEPSSYSSGETASSSF